MGDWGWAAALGGLGAIAGSFLSTLIVRWPEGRSIAHGRSECDHCGKTLGPHELIPLLSYLVQRGACRRCGSPINRRHPLFELGCTAIGALSGLVLPGPVGAGVAVFGWLLLALAALDVSHLWLPDALTGTLAASGIVTALLGFPPAVIDRVIGGVAGFAVLAAVAWGYQRVRGRVGIGGGDPKLFGAIGLWTGWQALPLVLLIASVLGLLVTIAALARGRSVKADDALPLGALLAIAAYPVLLTVLLPPP